MEAIAFREKVYFVVLVYLITIPLTGFLLGLLGGLIPFGQFSYRQRFGRASLIITIFLFACMLVLNLIRFIPETLSGEQ